MQRTTHDVSDPKAEMRSLAHDLQFDVVEKNGRFTLTRTAELPGTERRENLTLKETEDFLNNWKLRGLGGG